MGQIDTKPTPLYRLFARDSPQTQGDIKNESEVLEKDIHANRDQKKARVMIVISDKIDFKTESIIKDKEVHYIVLAKKFLGKPK